MYRGKENLKELSLFDNLVVYRILFTCNVTNKAYKVRGNLSCNSANVEYSINCKLLKGQYVGSTSKNNFKLRFRVHKSDINTGKGRCGVDCYPLF